MEKVRLIDKPTLLLCTERLSRGRSDSMDTLWDTIRRRVTNVDRYLFNSPYPSKSQYISEFLPFFDQKMALLHTFPHGSRIHDFRFCTRRDGRELLLVAAEDKRVSVYLLDQDELPSLSPWPIVATLVGHQNRYGHKNLVTA